MTNNIQNVKCSMDEPLRKHSTMRIGGPAKYFFTPKTVSELSAVIKHCRDNNLKYMILGNGSNILFMDEGYDGAVISTTPGLGDIRIEGNTIYAGAGAMLYRAAALARDNELTGMEFAAGIPGTIGGAVVMNAGAYGGEMKDIVSSVDILEEDGSIRAYSGSEMKFGYRKSIVDNSKVVVGVKLSLSHGSRDEINARMEELKTARMEKQPWNYPSAGSTFKRPEGYYAGKLIDDSGLRGYRVGGAMVSEKHCGFVVNYDNATAKDVLTLMDNVRQIVYDKFSVELEPEVRIIR